MMESSWDLRMKENHSFARRLDPHKNLEIERGEEDGHQKIKNKNRKRVYAFEY